MVSWPLVHCLLVIFHVRAHLHIGETRSELFATKFDVSPSALLSILFPAYSLIFQHIGVWIKIQVMALIFQPKIWIGA